MIKNYWKIIGTICLMVPLFLLSNGDAHAQKKKKKKGAQEAPVKKPTKPKPKKGEPKPYKQVITKDAISDEGLFTVHKVGTKHYFEIPTDVMDREFLVVSRISGFVEGLKFGGAGMKTKPPRVIRWEKHDNKVLLRSVSYDNVADPEDPIFQSLKQNNFDPIIMSFNLESMKMDSTQKDTTAYVIEVSNLFNSDVEMIGPLRPNERRQFGVRRLDKSRSMISKMKSFPENIVVKHVLTFDATKMPDNQTTNSLSVEMTQSFVLLPEEPMQARYYDKRLGFFRINQTDYSSDAHKTDRKTFITRWRLEPKDPEAYARGELVEPIKPIVYYIDPATPEKWKPYILQGVEDWKKAFEAAGFKNAIIGKLPPTKEEDPDFDPEDSRYSVIRYITTPIQNAQGPSVVDPRSGEIIESDILWYHNIMTTLRNWYFVQTAAVNPEARKAKFKDEQMGDLIRFVSAHEVGHTLGLPHNMGSSHAYPVDSLRSKSFTSTRGTAPSIMDYARFNYVAQPEDGITQFYPQVGTYDLHSIEWGYRRIPNVTDPDEEIPTLNKWILDHEGDHNYYFGRQTFVPIDPSAQTEDLGDNSMKASGYGIENLKRIVPNLLTWLEEDGKDYSNVAELYGQVLSQWNRYMGHVSSNIGGIYERNKNFGQEGVVYTHVPKERQEEAVNFLIDQAFNTPEWMIDKEILNRIEDAGMVNRIRSAQARVLSRVMDFSRLARMIENETMNGSNAYTVLEMMDDMRNGIFTETSRGRTVDTYRRNLQRAYVEGLEGLMTREQGRVPRAAAGFFGYTAVDVSQSDIRAVARGELRRLQSLIRRGASGSRDTMTRYHYEDLLVRIEDILNIED